MYVHAKMAYSSGHSPQKGPEWLLQSEVLRTTSTALEIFLLTIQQLFAANFREIMARVCLIFLAHKLFPIIKHLWLNYGYTRSVYIPLNFFKKWVIPGLFFVYYNLFKQILHFVHQVMWKMTIQYMVLGFEPKTFRTWVSSHNH